MDNQPLSLNHLSKFARREGVVSVVRPLLCDLRKELGGGVLASEFGSLDAAGPGSGLISRPDANEKAVGTGGQVSPLRLVVVSRFMHRAMLDRVVDMMPHGCFLAVHHFARGACSLKSGRPIKDRHADGDEAPLTPFELSRRYAETMGDVLLNAPEESVDGRPMWSYVARKLVRDEHLMSTGILSTNVTRLERKSLLDHPIVDVAATTATQHGALKRLEVELEVTDEPETISVQFQWL